MVLVAPRPVGAVQPESHASSTEFQASSIPSGVPVPDPDDDLSTLLGAAPPAGVLALDAGARAELAQLVRDARQRQSRSLEDAFSAALKHVPFPVRGIVKKVLLG